jgi:endonuclease IV
MYLIGPHCGKNDTADLQRANARTEGWGAWQTHAGNPKTLNLNPRSASGINSDRSTDLIWVVHGAYSALFNPPRDRQHVKQATFEYFTNLAEWMRRVSASYAVIHLGGTKDRDPDEVVAQAKANWGYQTLLQDFCRLHRIKFLIENVAAKYPTNQDLNYISSIPLDFSDTLGWCLDTAHSNAAGVPWENILALLEDPARRPTVIHANYPGSGHGSGRDAHGFYYLDATPVSSSHKDGWKRVVRRAYQLGIPLIMEGSGTYEGDTSLEVKAVQTLVQEP